MNEKKVNILLCDDHASFREGIKNIIEKENWICVSGEAENGEIMISSYANLKPDLVIADIQMPVMSGYQAAAQILSDNPDAKIMFLSMHGDEQYIYMAYKLGAAGMIAKEQSTAEILTAVREIIKGNKYFGIGRDDKSLLSLTKKFELGGDANVIVADLVLTDREKEILLLIGEPLSTEEIGNRLSLSKRTIDKVRENISAKLNLKGLINLVAFAVNYVHFKKNINDFS